LTKFDAKPFCFIREWIAEIDEHDILDLGPERIGLWPVLDILVSNHKGIILYPKIMTFLDGYDSLGDEMKYPVVIPEINRQARSKLLR
jgi:hypothetical protein